jgi:uncharacterized protein YegP (UPF0339 family)
VTPLTSRRVAFHAGDDVVECYRDDAHGWRWRRKATNGRILSDGGESFDSMGNAVRAARRANPDASKGAQRQR